jgi:hypothetical protein
MGQGSSPQPWPWNEMLDEFCALGGAAKNIAGIGQSGAGLFAVDPKDAVLLRVPRNLLLPLEDIEFVGGRGRLRETAGASEAERRFFERYESAFSRGPEEQTKTIAFVTALDALPVQIREFLIAEFGFDNLLEGDLSTRVQSHFLQRRAVRWRGAQVIAPLLELAARGAEGLRYERGMHLQIQGYVRDEIIVRHGAEDAFSIFCRFGVAESQPAAYSLSTKIQFEDKEIVIGRNTNEGVKRGEYRAPKVQLDGNVLTLSYLLLGHSKLVRLPRGTFCTLLREAGIKNPDEAFDRIVRFNAVRFVKLLQALEPHEGEMVSTLRRMARCQLEAMSNCIGRREIGSASIPLGQP